MCGTPPAAAVNRDRRAKRVDRDLTAAIGGADLPGARLGRHKLRIAIGSLDPLAGLDIAGRRKTDVVAEEVQHAAPAGAVESLEPVDDLAHGLEAVFHAALEQKFSGHFPLWTFRQGRWQTGERVGVEWLGRITDRQMDLPGVTHRARPPRSRGAPRRGRRAAARPGTRRFGRYVTSPLHEARLGQLL